VSATRYLILLACSCSAFLAFFLAIAMKMEAFSGSATRLGGYLEADYGWRQPQEVFAKPAFRRLAALDDYVEPVDIVVVGDSFSEDRKSGWLNYFAFESDLSAVFFHIDRIDPGALLQHPTFVDNPPKYFFLTSNEGLSLLRFERLADLEMTPIKEQRSAKGHRSPTHHEVLPAVAELRLQTRDTHVSLHGRLAATGDYVKKTALRAVFGDRVTEIVALPVDCAECFSNAEPSRALFMHSTIAPRPYPAAFVERAIAGLRSFRRAVEENGETAFYTIVFPSKLNVYSAYVRLSGQHDLIGDRLGPADVGFIDLRPALRRAVTDRVVDVYLPNDHHMGSAGYAVTAAVIADALGIHKIPRRP